MMMHGRGDRCSQLDRAASMLAIANGSRSGSNQAFSKAWHAASPCKGIYEHGTTLAEHIVVPARLQSTLKELRVVAGHLLKG